MTDSPLFPGIPEPMSTMPDNTIIPVLQYEDVERAITWLIANFGFKERWRIGNHRAQLTLGSSTIVVTKIGTSKASLLVRIENVNEHYERCKTAGLTILQDPADYPYGERQYLVEDLEGHLWLFSQTMQQLTPEDWGGVTASATE